MRGFVLQPDDALRRWVIQEIMCRFRIDKQEFNDLYAISFDVYFAREKEGLKELIEEGFVTDTAVELRATAKGRLLVRLIAVVFDRYADKGQFSRVV
jgi:oxygen-independent coproporphyrinogen-3 oxidase